MMIKQGDRVRVLSAMGLVKIVSAPTPRGVLVRISGDELELRHEDIELLCGARDEELEGGECPRGAELFVRATGVPLCPVHASAYPAAALADTRVDPLALVSCACGESMDAAPSAGTWTLEHVACAYRTCMHCGSSRPYMPADEVPGRAVVRYDDPHSSEASDEWGSLTEALYAAPPPHDRSVLIRNGVTLARAWRGPNGALGWLVQKPERETGVRV